MCLPESTLPSSTTTTTSELETGLPSRSQNEDVDRGTQSQNQNSDVPPSRASLSHLSMFPHLCCHPGLQTCTQTLGRQEGTDSPFSHTHAHHHFHHHHCPLTSCLPCPQLAHSHSARLSGAFPCLSCPHSFHACNQVCHRQHRQAQQQEERVRTSTTLLSSLHPCMHCSASFSRPSQLLQHQRSEHAHKPAGFICTECGRAFNSHSNLRIHLNVHTGARPYSCSDCGKSFSQSGALKIHRRIHTGEKPYSCGFCGRGFPHLAGVRAHQRTHTGEKPYRCNQCGKCFTQSGALKIHTRIHTGERPFICSICGKGFSNRSGIRFHYRTVHGLAPEVTGETGGVYRGPTGRACQPGRPRTTPPTGAALNAPNSPVGTRANLSQKEQERGCRMHAKTAACALKTHCPGTDTSLWCITPTREERRRGRGKSSAQMLKVKESKLLRLVDYNRLNILWNLFFKQNCFQIGNSVILHSFLSVFLIFHTKIVLKLNAKPFLFKHNHSLLLEFMYFFFFYSPSAFQS
uniref:C2H2-type domain-containing protein n=1 Tax=Astatotilapia calliptera TaxID=8154 RepID=A0A3P8PKQ5_ASTCA